MSLKVIQDTERKTDAMAKPKKSLRHDFSSLNWGGATDRWLKGVKKRSKNLFPEISKQARTLAGIKIKPTAGDTESSSSESDSDSSGRDLDSNHEGLEMGSDHQNEEDGEQESDNDGHGASGQQESDHNDDGHGSQSDNETGYHQEVDDEDGGAAEGINDLDADGYDGRVAGNDDYEMSEVGADLNVEASSELSYMSDV